MTRRLAPFAAMATAALFASVARSETFPPAPFVLDGEGEIYQVGDRIHVDTRPLGGRSAMRVIGAARAGQGAARVPLSEIPVIDDAFRLDFDIGGVCPVLVACARRFEMRDIRVTLDGATLWEHDAAALGPMIFDSAPPRKADGRPAGEGPDFALAISVTRVAALGATRPQGPWTGDSTLEIVWTQEQRGNPSKGGDDAFVVATYDSAAYYAPDQRIVPVPPAAALLPLGLGALAWLRRRR